VQSNRLRTAQREQSPPLTDPLSFFGSISPRPLQKTRPLLLTLTEAGIPTPNLASEIKQFAEAAINIGN